MKSSLKSFLVALILVAVLAVPLIQVPKTYSAELTTQDKTLTFLKDVVKLDITKYNATLTDYFVDYPPHWGGLAWEEVEYTLDRGDTSKLLLTCIFRDKTLSYCILEMLKGSPIYAESQPVNVLDATKGFLERYQTYSGASHFQEMRDMLNTVSATKNTTRSSGNVKLTISSQEVQNDPTTEAIKRTSFDWMYTINGIDVPQNVVSVTFDNGVFSFFKDDWNLCKVGSTTVTVSQEEAINRAMNAAKNYTLKVWVNEWIEVPFSIVDKPVTTELFMYPRETLTVYPFWRIQLYFDKLYYSAYGIEVGIWADTGETAYCESLSYIGGPLDGENPPTSTTEPSPPQSANNTNPPLNMYLIVATAAITTAIAIAAVALKKRSK